MKRQHREALTCFERAAKLDPEYPLANAAAGILQFRLGQTEKAESFLRRAVSAAPKNHTWQFELAQVLVKLEKFADAAIHFNQAAALNPGNLDILLGLAESLFAAGRVSDSFLVYERIASTLTILQTRCDSVRLVPCHISRR